MTFKSATIASNVCFVEVCIWCKEVSLLTRNTFLAAIIRHRLSVKNETSNFFEKWFIRNQNISVKRLFEKCLSRVSGLMLLLLEAICLFCLEYVGSAALRKYLQRCYDSLHEEVFDVDQAET